MQLSQGFTAEVKEEEGGDVHGSGSFTLTEMQHPGTAPAAKGGGPGCWEGMELQHPPLTRPASPLCYLAALLSHRGASHCDFLCEFLRR